MIILSQSKISHIATNYNGNIFAIAEFENKVYIWDIISEQMISEFNTILSFGGKRLAISSNGKLCATGAWSYNGIAVYATLTGNILWQRKDLKKVQRLKFSNHDNTLICAFENKPLHILDSSTGKTLEKLRSVKKFWESPFFPLRIYEKSKKKIELVNLALGNKKIKIPSVNHTLLDCTFTSNSIILSECTNGLSSYSIDECNLLWQHKPCKGNHFTKLAFNPENKEVLGVNDPYEKGDNGKEELFIFNKDTGKIIRSYPFDKLVQAEEFALKSSVLITSEGDVMDTKTGSIIKKILFPGIKQ